MQLPQLLGCSCSIILWWHVQLKRIHLLTSALWFPKGQAVVQGCNRDSCVPCKHVLLWLVIIRTSCYGRVFILYFAHVPASDLGNRGRRALRWFGATRLVWIMNTPFLHLRVLGKLLSFAFHLLVATVVGLLLLVISN